MRGKLCERVDNCGEFEPSCFDKLLRDRVVSTSVRVLVQLWEVRAAGNLDKVFAALSKERAAMNSLWLAAKSNVTAREGYGRCPVVFGRWSASTAAVHYETHNKQCQENGK